MTSTLVNALFVISFVLPPAVVAIGLVVLAWPRRQSATSRVAEQAHAH